MENYDQYHFLLRLISFVGFFSLHPLNNLLRPEPTALTFLVLLLLLILRIFSLFVPFAVLQASHTLGTYFSWYQYLLQSVAIFLRFASLSTFFLPVFTICFFSSSSISLNTLPCIRLGRKQWVVFANLFPHTLFCKHLRWSECLQA